MLGVVFVAALYEYRIKITHPSAVREFMGQGLIAVISAVCTAVALENDKPSTWWLWAAILSLFYIIELIRHKLDGPGRAGWIAIALVLCLSLGTPAFEWHTKILCILGVAGSLSIFACIVKSRFLAVLSLVIAAGTSPFVVKESSTLVSLQTIGTGSALVSFLFICRRTLPASAAIPWWTGFLQPKHELIVR